MLQFKVKEILEATGKKSPGTWLTRACGMSHGKAYKIVNNKQNSISLEDFSKLCENLNCTPNDLMYWKQTPATQLPETHPCITELKQPNDLSNWFKIFRQLTPEKILELREIAISKINEKGL